MKPLSKHAQSSLAARLLCSNLICALVFGLTLAPISAQTPPPRGGIRVGPDMPNMPTPPSSSSSSGPSDASKSTGPYFPSEPLGGSSTNSADSTNDISLSFQSANIDTIVQFLANQTGKAVVKHPQVNCQLTITSSKKTSVRDALNIVYSALALEGFTVIETTRSIYIVPEGKEPRMSPELLNGSQKDVPEGRRRLAKVFTLKHVQATDLKDKIRNALTDKATVDIDERANQIIITDYTDNIRVVGELIETLDSDKPQDLAVRVIPLKHMAALDLAKELTPLYQKLNTKTPKDAVDVAADERSNSLIVFSSEASFNALERLITGLDTEDAQEKTTETFILKNADAQDVAKQIQDLTQDSTITARYYYSYSGSGNQNNSKKTSVVADRRRNAIIVQAPPAQMDGIRRMVEELDAAIKDDSLAPKIYQMKFVSAVDIEDVLNELFLKKTQQPSYYDWIFGDGGSQSTTERDVGRLYGKVRITSEPYSNTIIVTANSKESLVVVEEVLKQLDVPSEQGESTLRRGLKFAKAATLARTLNILFAKNGAPSLRGGPQQQGQTPANNNGQGQQAQQRGNSQSGFVLEQEARDESYYPWIGGQPDNPRSGERSKRPVSDLVDRVRVVADEPSNALLISANIHFFPQILKLIDELDAPPDQVLIEARIIEVSSDFLDKLGVRWSPDGTTFTGDDLDNSIKVNVGGKYSHGSGDTTIINNPATAAAATALTPANLMAQIRSGVVDSTINLDFLIQFMRKTTDASVLAEPQINIRDNETGRLFVGQQVPILINSQNQGSIGQSQNFDYKNVGVILEVTPHINNAGDVALKIHAESSTVVPGVTVLGGAVFDTRTFHTDLTAKSGETRVLGGIIQKQMSDTLRKTPFLGDIPGIGWFFKKKDKSTREVELMVFLRPKVVHSSDSAADLMKEIEQKAPLIKRALEDEDLQRQQLLERIDKELKDQKGKLLKSP